MQPPAWRSLNQISSPDPAEWAPRGYAVVNLDIRGTWESEGNLYIEGSQPGIDAYGTIEYIAKLEWCNGGITMAGSIRGFNAAKSKNKWLRIHPTQEWYDLYLKEANDELQKFFDRYLKGIDNGWEKTASVRVSILTYGDRNGPQPLANLPFTEYPPKSTQYQRLYLTGSKTLSADVPTSTSQLEYQSDNLKAAPADFTYVFPEKTQVMGHSKVKLWLSCDENDDMDIYISLRKVDRNGKVLEHINVPWSALPDNVSSQEDVPNSNTIEHLGPSGVLRVSHRFLDQCVEFPQHIDGTPQNLNKGKHIIHVGGKHDLALNIPVVPV
ncbi:hypothetical protein FOXYS1_13812 [Fusarium oxysporum]|uniref:Xaa-Pro dipeptidyl-peptidase C-terminal domain-containing protein n=1 Tax=Fusarium oxysporum TaxID=5507 RepID=A0A8H5EEI6_FUSOX|nr:hypothetical protein FOXYS1_13812 [Fusarium oxysporum]